MWLTGVVAPRHVGSSQTRARTRVPCIGRQILNHCATREAQKDVFKMTFLSKIAQIYPEIYTSGDAESLYIYAHTHVNVCENIKQEHIDKSNECILVIFYMVTHQLVHYLARFRGLLTEVKKCLPKYEPAPQEVR